MHIKDKWDIAGHVITNQSIETQLSSRLLWLKILQVRLESTHTLEQIGINHNFSSYKHKTTLQPERVRQLINKSLRFLSRQQGVSLAPSEIALLEILIKSKNSLGERAKYMDRISVKILLERVMIALKEDIESLLITEQ